jgi:hypothetical protein
MTEEKWQKLEDYARRAAERAERNRWVMISVHK